MKPEIQENLMQRYLLGDLPEPQATALEQEVFADDEKFELMWETENRLVDGYVRGRLSSEDRERFERHYLASPVHRQRVAASRSLIEEADRTRAEEIATEPKPSSRSRLFEKWGALRATWRFAMAAAMLLLAAGSLWLLIDRARLRNEIEQLRAGSEATQGREEALADKVADARVQSDRLAAELERLRAERNAIAQQTAEPTPANPPPPKVLSFALSPVLIRGGGDPQALKIPPGTDLVHLQMRADREDARRFQVVVRTVEGRQVWKQQTIKPHRDGAPGAVITASIPAGKLPHGDYILTLSAVNSTGEPEEVNRYFFRVSR